MKEQVTTTLLHFDFHDISFGGWVLYGFFVFTFLYVLFCYRTSWRYEEEMYPLGFLAISFLFPLISSFVTLIFMITPISVTQRTSVQTQTYQILEKRSTTSDLGFLVKDHDNVISVKEVDFSQANLDVKTNNTSESYITTTEIVTYEGHSWLQFFKNVPKDTIKTTVSLPQKFLK